MATVTNPTTWSLYSHALGREIPANTTITGVKDDLAEEICASGVFVLSADEQEEAPKRRSRTQRGSQEVEEAIEPDRETR